MRITSRYERIGLEDKKVREIGRNTSARKVSEEEWIRPLPVGGSENGVGSVTREREKRKWTLRGTCNDTSHKSIVPTEDECGVRTRKDRHGGKEYGL
jgi:hypothetical protein